MAQRKFRFYWWIFIAFVQKNFLLFVISFAISFTAVAGYLYLSPFIISTLSARARIIGVAGNYQIYNLPTEIMRRLASPFVYTKDDGTYTSDYVTIAANDDHTVYTLKIKPGAQFNDGTPLTSHDITFQFKDVTIERPDDKTITYTLTKPFLQFPSYLQKTIFQTQPIRALGGTYVLSSYKLSPQQDKVKQIVLKPLLPDKQTLLYKFYNNEADLLTAYKLGEVDSFRTSLKAEAEALTNWPNTSVLVSRDNDKIATLFLNTQQEPLKDTEFRQAVGQVMPWRKFAAYGQLAQNPLSPVSFAHSPDIKHETSAPEPARIALQKARTSTESAHLVLSAPFELLDVANLVKAELDRSGQPTDIKVSFASEDRAFDFLLALWNVPIDVNQYFFWHSSQINRGNITNLNDKRIDKILEDVRATDSASMQQKLLTDFQQRLVDEAPALFLYYPNLYTIERKSSTFAQ